jgi:hypothetical protein
MHLIPPRGEPRREGASNKAPPEGETPFAAAAAKRLECLQEKAKGIENG